MYMYIYMYKLLDMLLLHNYRVMGKTLGVIALTKCSSSLNRDKRMFSEWTSSWVMFTKSPFVNFYVEIGIEDMDN